MRKKNKPKGMPDEQSKKDQVRFGIPQNIRTATSFVEQEFGKSKFGKLKPNLVFVIMPFVGEGIDEIYSTIKDECAKIGFDANRVNENTGSGFIIKDVIDLIIQAEFIICDLTYERPNVYYELGYAHGLGNNSLNILLVAKEGTKLHFDISPLRVQYYNSTVHLREIVRINLEKMPRRKRPREIQVKR